jgi:hypothetical protein
MSEPASTLGEMTADSPERTHPPLTDCQGTDCDGIVQHAPDGRVLEVDGTPHTCRPGQLPPPGETWFWPPLTPRAA